MTIAQTGTLALLLATLLLPGLATGLAAGLRGWLLLGSAPLLTYGVIAVGAPIAPSAFGGWSIPVFLLFTAVTCVVLLAVRLLAPRVLGGRFAFADTEDATPPWQPVHHVGVGLMVLATAALGLYVVSRATDGFTAVHQFWDAIFHANSIRFIADTGNSSPNALGAIRPDAGALYYPNGFHVQLASVLMIDDARLVDLLDLRAGITAGVFALSMVALVRGSSGRPALAAAVAALCGAFSTFPYDLAYFGPIWPFSAAVAALPAFMALFVEVLRRPRPAVLLLTCTAMLGLSVTHLSVAVAAAVFGAAYVVQRWWTARRVRVRDLGVLGALGALAVVAVLPVMIQAGRGAPAAAVDWPIITTPGGALGILLFLNHDGPYPQWWLVAAMVLGLFALGALRELGWWFAGTGVFVVLFVMAAAYEGPLVALLTGPWWNDRWRFLALVAPGLILLGANGLVWARDQVLRLPVPTPGPVVWRRGAALVVVVGLLAVLSNGMYRSHNIARVAGAYTDGPTVSHDERAALAELAGLAPAGTLVMNDPNDGSAWMWALYDVRPVFGHAIPPGTAETVVDADRTLLYERFDELDTDEDVREAVRRLRIEYVFVGDGYASPTSDRIAGLDELDEVADLDEVFGNDQARIYRVGADLTTGR